MTVGIGNAGAPRDREVVNLTAGEPLLPGASIDVSVSAASTGFGTEPVELRVSATAAPSKYGGSHPQPTARRCMRSSPFHRA